MKTKKALAVFLAVVMLVLPLAVSSFAATENAIVTNPVKTTYNDTEVFSPQGLTILADGDEIVYSPADEDFRFEPALNELLTVNTDDEGAIIPTAVAVYYNNEYIGSVDVIVNHILGDITVVGNGHGQYCLGCGTLHNFEKHYDYSAGEDANAYEPEKGDYDYVGNWVPNDDGGIFLAQTTTGTCSVCGAEVTRNIPGTAKFDSLFDEDSLTIMEGTIVYYISTILVSLIQMLVGIK